MRFACDSCHTRYNIADEKVRGRVLRIRCKSCGAEMIVKGPQEEAPVAADAFEDAATTTMSAAEAMELARSAVSGGDGSTDATRTMPAAEAAALVGETLEPAPAAATGPVEWYALIDKQQVGPLLEDELAARLSDGTVTERTYVWREGLGDWKRLAELPDLASLKTTTVAPAVAAPPVLEPAPAAPEEPARQTYEMPSTRPVVAAEPTPAPVSLQRSAGPATFRPSRSEDRNPRRKILAVAGAIAFAIVAAIFAWRYLTSAQPGAAGGELSVKASDVGPLDRAAVDEALAANLPAYESCLHEHPGPGGRIEIRAVVSPSGQVQRATAQDASKLGACLADATRGLRFPSFQGEPHELPVTVTAP